MFVLPQPGCISSFFKVTNGVRQGSLLSPLLFSVYMDDLSIRLSSLNIGCFSGNKIMNHIMYADDITLISPSLFGLRTLLKTCEDYSHDFDIKFNGMKCKCLTFSAKRLSFTVGKVIFCDVVLDWVSTITYLGVKLSWNLDDKSEVMAQLRNFYARSNFIIRRFSRCSVLVKLRLFMAFCSNIYLCQLWLLLPKFVLNRFRIARNNVVRKIVGLPSHCSASEMLVFYRIDNFDASLRMARAKFYDRLCKMDNIYIKSFLNSDAYQLSRIRLLLLQQTLV